MVYASLANWPLARNDTRIEPLCPAKAMPWDNRISFVFLFSRTLSPVSHCLFPHVLLSIHCSGFVQYTIMLASPSVWY
jgi:hypothetical protein